MGYADATFKVPTLATPIGGGPGQLQAILTIPGQQPMTLTLLNASSKVLLVFLFMKLAVAMQYSEACCTLSGSMACLAVHEVCPLSELLLGLEVLGQLHMASGEALVALAVPLAFSRSGCQILTDTDGRCRQK